MKHTNGPWSANDEHNPNYESYQITGFDEMGINIIIAHGVPARQMPLVKTAPELLEALEFVIDNRGLKITDAVCQAIQSVIAKAKGQ